MPRDRLRLDDGDSITIGDRYEVDITDGNVPIVISFRATETDLGRVDLEDYAEVRVSGSGEIVLARPTGFGDFACRVLLEYDVDTIAF